MENQVVNIKSMSIDQSKKAIGQDTGSENKNNIPRLSINRNPDDEQGNTLPVGSFMVYDPNNFTPRRGVMTRYAKKVVRPEFFGKVYIDGLKPTNKP